MFKIALNAGHGLYTAGKRCLKSIDPKETREWWLNARICEKVEAILSGYEGYELLRLDDRTGKVNVSLKKRCDEANRFGAHIYVSVHHNAGIKGGNGGGIVAYTYKGADSATNEWRLAFYNALIKHTGLRGNRVSPLATKDLYECRETKMPAVLLECGFMDSAADTPIILTEKFADGCAAAISEVLITRCGLTPKSGKKPAEAPTAKPAASASPSDKPIALPEVHYQVYTVKSGWLSNVEGDSDFAGLKNQPIRCVYANLTDGDIEYQVHTLGGRWLPWVKNREDYAGLYGKEADCVRVRLPKGSPYSVQCRVAAVGRDYYPWVTDTSDYAGVYGKKIDRLQIRIIKKQ